MTSFARKVGKFIDAGKLLSPGAKVIVGLSGGADSTALLAVLSELGYDCVALNCNFHLRGDEAERDSLHAELTAKKLGAQFFRRDFDARDYASAKGISLEMACRDLRYGYFSEMLRSTGAEAVAVGHHRDDNVETFFLNLLRGSGIHGLRGMLPKRDTIIRPFLGVTRSEILGYLAERNLEYVEDSSNLENDFKRNKLRNIILPLIEREFPGATAKIADSVNLLRENEQLYNSLLPEIPDSITGAMPTLIYEWFSAYGFNPDQCASIATAQSGAVFTSPTHELTICPGGKFELIQQNDHRDTRPELSGQIVAAPANFIPRPGVLYLDADAIPAEAEWHLRPWQPADRMRPFGMSGSRPVSDILAEAGIAANRRGETYVLTLNGDILWAIGFRTSALYPVTENTTRIIEIYHEKI